MKTTARRLTLEELDAIELRLDPRPPRRPKSTRKETR